MIKKFIAIQIGNSRHIIDILSVKHIFEPAALTLNEENSCFAGSIKTKDTTYPVFDNRKRIDKNFSANNENRIIIAEIPLHFFTHFQKAEKRINAGFFVDKVVQTITADDKNINEYKSLGEDIPKCIVISNEISLLIDFSKYLQDEEKKQAYNFIIKNKEVMEKEKEEKAISIKNRYSHIFEKNKIEELWKKKHLNKQ